MENLKKYENFNSNQPQSEVNEGLWDRLFGKPSIHQAAHDSYRGQGWSATGRDNVSRDEHNYVMFDGKKFYSEDIVYDDYNSTEPIPRIEGGKLIIANPAWSE
jgi:hypothetical protein